MRILATSPASMILSSKPLAAPSRLQYTVLENGVLFW